MGTVFSEAEFERLLSELFDENGASFDTLVAVAEKTLRPYIHGFCSRYEILRGQGHEDDIMQEIYIRLITKSIPFFFLKGGAGGEINRNPVEFQKWMYTVAKNIACSYAERLWKTSNPLDSMDDEEHPITVGAEDEELSALFSDDRELLSRAFALVLDADIAVYKTLSWIAVSLLMLKGNISKIASTNLVVRYYETMTLWEMFRVIMEQAESLPWLTLSPWQCRQTEERLSEKLPDGRRLADVPYGEFFMKKGGRESISDWENRVNRMLAKRLGG